MKISEKLKMSDYKTLLEISNYDINVIKEKYSIAKTSKTEIKNLVGWLVKAINTDYKQPIAMEVEKEEVPKVSVPKTTNKFNQFPQRNYTKEEIDDLEKRLLSK